MKKYLIYIVIALALLMLFYHKKIMGWFSKEEVVPVQNTEKKADEVCLRETTLGGKKIMVPCRSSIASDADAVYVQDVINATGGLSTINANLNPVSVNHSNLIPT